MNTGAIFRGSVLAPGLATAAIVLPDIQGKGRKSGNRFLFINTVLGRMDSQASACYGRMRAWGPVGARKEEIPWSYGPDTYCAAQLLW